MVRMQLTFVGPPRCPNPPASVAFAREEKCIFNVPKQMKKLAAMGCQAKFGFARTLRLYTVSNKDKVMPGKAVFLKS